jgi:hypothetical protein
MTRDQPQEVYVRPFPGGREVDGAMGSPNFLLFDSHANLCGLRGPGEFKALMSDLLREHEGYRKEFGFARDDASL